jgi:hypothetical protein
MDDVRIKHEARSREAQDKASLNTSLLDIELAVSVGNDKHPESTETAPPDLMSLLETVTGEVSSKSGSGGILNQVKEFNAFLERAALALEGRA